jgi:3-methyladenine DNA glycosylase/8-oxoguanine DNA glycosylase
MDVTLTVRSPFDFPLMVDSYGWVSLRPFRWIDGALEVVIPGPSGAPIAGTVTSRIDVAGRQKIRFRSRFESVDPSHRDHIRDRIRWMLRLDDDLEPFHHRCRSAPGFAWIAERGLGRILRNGSWFEEFAKVLLTTNVAWSGTRRMVDRLIEGYGPEVGDVRGFPEAAAIAGLTEAELRGAGLGYRAAYLLDLASNVASGRLDLEEFADPTRDTDELAAALSALHGFGPYAVNALFLSLGRYDRLILDSWTRPTVAKRYHGGRRIKDRTIERRYASWGEYRGLALWFDCAQESWMGATVGR